jgi:Uma2 family endonuclease
MAVQPGTHAFTVDDLHLMVAAGILAEDARVELLDGQIVEMTPIGLPHAACVDRLTRLLAHLAASERATLRVQGPLQLADHELPQPDVALLGYRADGYRDHYPTPADARLVIEVGDTSVGSDRSKKIPRYARAGVHEAWLVNLPADCVEIFREPRADRYADVRTARRGETVTPLAFPDLALAVAEILG